MEARRTLTVLNGPDAIPAVMPQPPPTGSPAPGWFAPDGRLPALTDRQGRPYRYLRISVTDRCNMACAYCMPEGGEHEHALRRDLLSFEEIVRVGRIFAEMGVTRARLTGGEPLLRRDLADLVRGLSADAGLAELWLTTNGARLPFLARDLATAGLRGVNVSLDSLHAKRFAEITRGGQLEEVVNGIDAALEAGLQVKLNTVALRDLNDTEFESIAIWAWERGITPRFIELMPLGEGSRLLPAHHLPLSAVRERLSDLVVAEPGPRDSAAGPASYFEARDGSSRRVGLIGAISDNFCSNCNRVRLTSRGEIVACVASRTAAPLKALIHAGFDDRDIAWAIHTALQSKLAGHRFLESPLEPHGRGMSLVGG